MTKPLAVIFFENLVIGTQLVNRLANTGYRVSQVTAAAAVVSQVEKEMPLVLFIDAEAKGADMCDTITRIRKTPATAHIPIIAVAGGKNTSLQTRARAAGAALVASDTAFLDQLPALLDQALALD
jgi:CheY-like chemotaxis protein